ncbi:TonB-dependent receptor [Bordetella bronchiseptica]|uniref:TonB-dependent receptor yncD n=2 Tax=Bordetella bronchiseptica TaxID=518 RepID=A0ABR4RQA9_BORBO|nr:TonB-dependent receptor [Bordetella bronchiseptica]SHS91992.1 Colicin I receptor precursor [Mycobacteroides abscessus subsp. abscessus]AWP73682.1 TonB-dependent siderophore receptor [Bordetella bronchiseptica]AZW20493.1 TonB-dependent receptor [Bordetella bronchiseptica]KCV38910.1 putative TonB-dependent receptor yncD [Bordetella bronchiseptica 00-P-2796]KDB98906.1 putative TonB-dependent receptor yncD [Bordetella bronchiseptica D993]
MNTLRRLRILGAAATLGGPAAAQEAPAMLEPVRISGTRTGTSVLDTPASVDVVDGDDLRARNLQVNLSEGLAGVPGLQLQNRQNYAQDLQLSIRGFGARSTFGVRGVRLYVDGIPATMPDGQGQTSNIDIGSAGRVEVLRGPFSALYGNSSGGVVQVFTEQGSDPPEATGSAAAGSFGTWRYGAKLRGASAADGLDYVLDFNRFTTEGYRDHSAARKNLGNARLGLRMDDGSRLTLSANHVDLTAQDPLGLTREQFEDDPRSAPVAERFDTRKTVRQTQGGLLYERAFDTRNDLRVMLYYGQRRTTQYQSIPVAVQQSPTQAGGVIDLGRDYGGADLRWTSRQQVAGLPLTLIGGLAYDTMKEQRRGYDNYTGPPAAPTGLGVKGALRRDETNTVYNLDPYLQASWQFAERWTLDAGLRYSTVRFDSDDHYQAPGNGDDSGRATYRKALPVAALRYAANENLSLYASYGRGFETPTLNELSYRPDRAPGLNFGLRPAVSTNLEAGVKWRTGAGLVTAALFHTQTDDEIVSAGSLGGRATYRNAGRTRRDGVELQWNGEFARHARAQLAYTWLDARYRDDGPGAIRAGNRIPGVAAQALYAALSWAPPQGWQAGIEARYLGRIEVNDANSEAAPAYFVAAASAGYAWRAGAWSWNAYARVDNLFGRRYAGSVIVNEANQRYYEPAPGRNGSIGLSAAYTF